MSILNEIGKRILFFDGAMGTMLQKNGLKAGELPERWNLEKPQILVQIHKEYLEAGADIILANTFGANPFKYGDETESIIEAGIKNAKEAVKQSSKKAYIALDMGPTGMLLKPFGTLDFEDAVSAFGRMAAAGEKAGADLILIETMNDTYELKAAITGAKEHSSLPVMATAAFSDGGKMLTGADPQTLTALVEGLGADAFGMNCGYGPKQLAPIFTQLAENASIPLIISPNAGLPKSVNGNTVYDIEPEEFAQEMKKLILQGAWLAGGCCGTTPAHIKALTQLCADMVPVERENKQEAVICSYSHAACLGKGTAEPGKSMEPLKDPDFKQALIEDDIDYVIDEAQEQVDDDADIIDINVAIPEIDEAQMIKEALSEVQGVIALPIQISIQSPEAAEAALRAYNGKALLNIANVSEENIERVFAAVKKYGAVIVYDEEKISADKIYEMAAHYGIDRKNIVERKDML